MTSSGYKSFHLGCLLGISWFSSLISDFTDDARESQEKEQATSFWNESGSHFALHRFPLSGLSFPANFTQCPWIIHALWHACMRTRLVIQTWFIHFLVFENVILLDFFPPVWFNCFVSFNHLLLIINASCNFLIYVSVGDKFKTTIDKFCQSKGFGCAANCFKSTDHPSSPLMDANHEAANAPTGANVVKEENGKAIPLLPVTKPLSTQTISTTVSVTNNGRNQVMHNLCTQAFTI